MNLKEAKERNKLQEFIKEREKDTPLADKDKFDKALDSMLQEKHSACQKSSD